MIDSESPPQVRPLESFTHSRFGLLAIASFIVHDSGGQNDSGLDLDEIVLRTMAGD